MESLAVVTSVSAYTVIRLKAHPLYLHLKGKKHSYGSETMQDKSQKELNVTVKKVQLKKIL